MLELMEGMPSGVVAVRAVGKVTADDYHAVLDPAVEASVRKTGTVRILYVLGPDFESYSLGAMLADTAESRHLGRCERMAVVTDVGWVRDAVGLFRHAMPARLELYAVSDLDAAKAWVSGS
ncbi:MAG: STAS/SEC14 domain-containing protein [Chloroflexota bacterium]